MWTKLHTKGKLHNHDEIIHLQDEISGKVIDHICIANINTALDKDSQIFWQNRIVQCVNNFDALTDKLKGAREANEYLAGCVNNLTIERDELVEACKEGLAECERALIDCRFECDKTGLIERKLKIEQAIANAEKGE